MNLISRRTFRPSSFAMALLAGFALPCATMLAQISVPPGVPHVDSAEAMLTLPDEPGTLRYSSSVDAAPPDAQGAPVSQKLGIPAGPATRDASRTQKYIEPGQVAPKLTAPDKVLLGIRDAVSPLSAVGWVASAGWEQLVNGSPNYGSNGRGFAQRLGAAALRDTTEGIFSDSVMSPILHEDPRYYRMGPSRNFFVRLVYAGTRPIITRTDGGRTTPNLALLSGTLAGAALTNAYYPQLNRGATQTMETFGGSLGGAALGDVVSEFLADALQLFHSGHKQ